MMNRQEALSFAKSSASMAADQKAAYDDAASAFFDNLIDTLNDEKVIGNDYHDALQVYQDTIAANY